MKIDLANRDKQFMALLHEIHHIMGLNSQAWSRFYNKSSQDFLLESDVIINVSEADIEEGERFSYIVKQEGIKKWISNHIGCTSNSVKGIPLENMGKYAVNKAHWDRTVVGNDLVFIFFF